MLGGVEPVAGEAGNAAGGKNGAKLFWHMGIYIKDVFVNKKKPAT